MMQSQGQRRARRGGARRRGRLRRRLEVPGARQVRAAWLDGVEGRRVPAPRSPPKQPSREVRHDQPDSPPTQAPQVDDVEEAMRDVVDPELGINVVDLGLVYGITVDEDNIADDRHDADLGGLPADRRDRGPDPQRAHRRTRRRLVRTSGSTGSGCRRGVRTRSPTTAASSCAPSASTSDLAVPVDRSSRPAGRRSCPVITRTVLRRPRTTWLLSSGAVITASPRTACWSRILLTDALGQPGDRIGLVGRNGAGKTTSLRVLAGEALPHGGTVDRQRRRSATCRRTRAPATSTSSPATGCCPPAASTSLVRDMAQAAGRDGQRSTTRSATPCRAPLRPTGGPLLTRWAATRPRARRLGSAASLGLPDRVLAQPLRTLSGGQRRRVELARILFSGAETLLLDEPTNHLDADSIAWLRDFLRAHEGGLVVISHDVDLLETIVNRVLPPRRQPRRARRLQRRLEDLPRAARDRRAAPPPRAGQRRDARRRTVAGPGRQMRARRPRRRPRRTWRRGPNDCSPGLGRRAQARPGGASCGFPNPAPCGKVPLSATGLSKSYGSLEVFTDVDLADRPGGRAS